MANMGLRWFRVVFLVMGVEMVSPGRFPERHGVEMVRPFRFFGHGPKPKKRNIDVNPMADLRNFTGSMPPQMLVF